MRKTCRAFVFRILLIFCLLGPMPRAVRAQPPGETAVAVVSEGKGTASSGNRNAVPLRPTTLVYSGWKLTCARGSKRLVLVFNDNSKITLTPQDRPYRVPFVPRHTGILDALLVPAGRNQSVGGSVFSPPPEGCVWPSQFVFRWTPLPKGASLKLILRRFPDTGGDDAPLWAKAITEDGTGSFTSPEARNALTRLRDQDPAAQVGLTFVTPDGQSTTVVFGLLLREEEARLAQTLVSTEKDDPLLRHVARASLFQQARLYSEAADEMEQALLVSPRSAALQRAALWADRRSGNLAREEYHRQSLSSGAAH